jgi:hypothetical protein
MLYSAANFGFFRANSQIFTHFYEVCFFTGIDDKQRLPWTFSQQIFRT